MKDKDSKKYTLIKVNKILILSQLYVFSLGIDTIRMLINN